MAIFYVLTPPVPTNPEKETLFVEDRFSWTAFLFPLPWLLIKRMWLVAGLAIAFYLVCVIIAEQWRLDGLPMAFSLILSLWTSLEGNHIRAKLLQRKGWTLQAEITANDLEDAEEIYFSRSPSSDPVEPVNDTYTQRPHHGTMALGLIGPYGDR